MSIDRVETFLAILQRAQVLTPQEVQEVARELGPHFTDPHDLARYLVEIDWLTNHQVRLLFSDRWQELTIGPYLILDRLGEGGVSEVFKAWDTVHGRMVALKVLHPHLTDHSAAVRQLQRELQAVTRLSHPNIIRTFEANQIGKGHYFAMEYVEGLDLDSYVRRCGPLPIEEACEYVRQTAQGLQHAQQLGLVHRDIKPANLFLINPPREEGRRARGEGREKSPVVSRPSSLAPRPSSVAEPLIKILDWGLARVRPESGPSLCPPQVGGDKGGDGADLYAEKGIMIGTADYIAPEQACDPCLVDIRADIYSLGCTLYFLLAGRPPFHGGSLMQKLLQHREAERPQLRKVRPDVPEELDAVVGRMMARRPEERYAIPLLAAAALRPFAAGRPASSPGIVRPKKPSTAVIDLSASRPDTSDS